MLDRVSSAASAVVLIVEDEPLLREIVVEFVEEGPVRCLFHTSILIEIWNLSREKWTSLRVCEQRHPALEWRNF